VLATCLGFFVTPEAMALIVHGVGSLAAYIVAFAVMAWGSKARVPVAGALKAGAEGVT
jgi:hypothetical protein